MINVEKYPIIFIKTYFRTNNIAFKNERNQKSRFFSVGPLFSLKIREKNL
jgi:hypothetical protein